MKELLARAIAYVGNGTRLDGEIRRIGELELPDVGAEDRTRWRQIEAGIGLLKAYVAAGAARRPLSIAVFGPPGSGKSTFVRQIATLVGGCRPVVTANLTQLSGPEALVEVIQQGLNPPEPPAAGGGGLPSLSGADRTLTPFFFIDEFDTTLNDAALGWLRWFLGPMQDGKVLANGVELKIGKAIFVFAGGTAESLDEFNRRAQLDPGAYRARKVPDFVSRLRGAIEIGGLNGLGSARIVPRAIVLRRLLVARSGTRLNTTRIGQILTDGHFVHGVRSMETLLDAGVADGSDLPDDVRSQHFTRGLLDGRLIGISAGLDEPMSKPVLSALTAQLLSNGASLAYGGAFVQSGTLQEVVDAARQAPPELGADPQKPRPKRVFNYLGYPASLNPSFGPAADALAADVEFIGLPTLDASELRDLGAPAGQEFRALPNGAGDPYIPSHHAAWAISLFRMRLRMIQDLSALIVLGGKDDGQSWGRFAGVAEEVMIAVALGKPVYVLGGAGGAAHATGRLLGLDATMPDLQRCLVPPAREGLRGALEPYRHCFEIPGEPESPFDIPDVRAFLYHRGATTAAWPWNGLSHAENRDVFACPLGQGQALINDAVDLIVKGLSRVDWKS